MAETKTNNLEREYTIPLRKEWAKVPRYKRTNKAVKGIKEFLVRHMKIRDRDLKKVKINISLNEILWQRGIKKPPAKIKVKAIQEGENIKVSAVNLPDKIKFKEKKREETEKKAIEMMESKKSFMQKAKEGFQEGSTPKTLQETPEDKEKKKEDEKEKKSAIVESGEKIEKEEAKKTKHQSIGQKENQNQVRKTLTR